VQEPCISGTTIGTGIGNPGDIRFFDADTGNNIATATDNSDVARSSDANDTYLVFGDAQGFVLVYDQSGNLITNYTLNDSFDESPKIAIGDDDVVVTGGNSNSYAAFNADDGTEVSTWIAYPPKDIVIQNGLAIYAEDEQDSATLVARNISDGSVAWENTTGLSDTLRAVEANDQYVVAGGDGNEVGLFDISDGSLVHQKTDPTARVTVVTLTPTYFVAGSDDGNVRFYEISSGNLALEESPSGNNNAVRGVKFAIDVTLVGEGDGLFIYEHLNVIDEISVNVGAIGQSISLSDDRSRFVTGGFNPDILASYKSGQIIGVKDKVRTL
jgi:WD40 repeat protein